MELNRIAIIGGGIGGLASAILLARQGFDIHVYEQAECAGPVGAGFLLQPPGQAVLEKLGVLEEVCQRAVPIQGLESITKSYGSTHYDKTLLDLKYADLKGAPRHGLGVQRRCIYEALLNQAQSFSNVVIHWDSHVDGCEANESEQVRVQVNGQSEMYDLCILSSGSNSELADQHFEGRICNNYEWGCLWATITLPDALTEHTLHQRCQSSTKMMGILPVRRTETGIEAALYWSAKSKEIRALDADSFSAMKTEMLNFWPEAAASIEPLKQADFIGANYRDVWSPKPFALNLSLIHI